MGISGWLALYPGRMEKETEFHLWLTEIKNAESEIWARDFGADYDKDELPEWSLCREDVFASALAKEAGPRGEMLLYQDAYERGVSPQHVADVTRAVMEGDDIDFERGLISHTPPKYIQAVNEAYSDYQSNGFPKNVEQSEWLYEAGVPVEYAVGCLQAKQSVDHILQMWSEGIPLEYVLAMRQ